MLAALKSKLGNVSGVREIRGRGLMLAVELDRPCKELLQRALDSGILINVTTDNVIRLLPPLIFTDAEADLLVEKLDKVIRAFLESATKY